MNCDQCYKELIPVNDRMNRYNDFPQYHDALVIDIHGGYGMLIDPIGGLPDHTRFILCKECGTQFVRENKFMITPETEHLVPDEESP